MKHLPDLRLQRIILLIGIFVLATLSCALPFQVSSTKPISSPTQPVLEQTTTAIQPENTSTLPASRTEYPHPCVDRRAHSPLSAGSGCPLLPVDGLQLFESHRGLSQRKYGRPQRGAACSARPVVDRRHSRRHPGIGSA